MANPEHILIRFSPEGKIGAHIAYYAEDGITPNPHSVRALDTKDFPAQVKETVEQLLGDFATDIINDNTRLRRERNDLRTQLEAKEAVAIEPKQEKTGLSKFFSELLK